MFDNTLILRSRRLRHVPATAFTALLVFAVACGDARGASAHADVAPPPIPVRVASVHAIDAATVVASGTLGTKDDVPLAFKLGGVVSRIAVDAGDRVTAGQVLAELDLREIDAAVAKATATAEKARRDAARVERLFKDSVATLAQSQDAQTARDIAEADLRAARMNREYAVIVAPTSGVVLERPVNPGSQVAPGTRVLLLGSSARGVVFRAGLPDRDVVRVRPGNTAVVAFDALPGREVRGVVRQVGPSADPRSGTYTVEVSLPDAVTLPNGLVGRVRIRVAPTTRRMSNGAASIPAEALVEGERARGVVFVMDSVRSIALRRDVALIGVDGDRVLVRGIDESAKVITAGAAWLRDSARVEVRP
jgi:membrane fusion protein, multidrug efflux system